LAAKFGALDSVVEEAVGKRFSAAVVRVERRGTLLYERAFGSTTRENGALVYPDTRFDLASLTKLFSATLALRGVAAGRWALDDPLAALLTEWHGTAHEPITWRDVLAHVSGMHSGADYRLLLDQNVVAYTLGLPLAEAPRRRVIYSDLGFIALAVALERGFGRPLARTFEAELAALELEATAYTPREREREAIPATEREAWRGLVQGFVHDEKCYLMGGVSAHAGLFGTARDVARLSEAFLAALRGTATFLPPSLAREAVSEQAPDPVLRRGLGWALRTSAENSCGVRVSAATFGHTGFTGTSVWSDPERELTIVLLTNAVHFGRQDLRDVRAAVTDRAVEAADTC
jgi:CubicO group peptidase (beta-lactamase class C family)